MPAERQTLTAAAEETSTEPGCAHHWRIETPSGESSVGHCKRCGATRSFLNYSPGRTMTRSVKAAPASGASRNSAGVQV